MKKVLPFYLLVLFFFNVSAQHTCAPTHLPQSPEEKAWQEALEQKYQLQYGNLSNSFLLNDYTIPVVVHIIHSNGPENISDELVQQGIDYLNASLANNAPYNSSIGVTTPFQLCLAQVY